MFVCVCVHMSTKEISEFSPQRGLSAQDLRQPLVSDALLHGGRCRYLREQLQLRGGRRMWARGEKKKGRKN